MPSKFPAVIPEGTDIKRVINKYREQYGSGVDDDGFFRIREIQILESLYQGNIDAKASG